MLSNIYHDYIFKNIQKEYNNENNNGNSIKYNLYKCSLEIKYAFKEHKPINMIIYEDNRFLVNINNTYTLVIIFKDFVKNMKV